MKTVARLLLLGCFAAPAVAAPALPPPTITYNNETNSPNEVDFVNVQFPSTLSANPLATTGIVYGRIYEPGFTEANGPNATVVANVGYGAAGSDPRTTVWTWFTTSYNVQLGNDDEYQGTMTAPALPGTYSYAYRFSLDNGVSFTLADLDGAGSNVGLDFQTTQLGTLTVLPEPSTIAFVGMCGLFGGRRRAKSDVGSR